MTEFPTAFGLFLLAHLIPASPAIRGALIGRFGRTAYLVAYSALSTVLLVWLIVAARRADTLLLWEPAPWQWIVPVILMPFVAVLMVCGVAAPNPLSISFRSGTTPGAITRVTRHPVVWAFLIWALAHIPPNGRLVSVVLFSGLALFSVAGFALLDAKARRRLGADRWRELSAATSIIPFAAVLGGRAAGPRLRDLAVPVLVSLVICLWFVLQGHQLVIGVDPLAGFSAFF